MKLTLFKHVWNFLGHFVITASRIFKIRISVFSGFAIDVSLGNGVYMILSQNFV